MRKLLLCLLISLVLLVSSCKDVGDSNIDITSTSCNNEGLLVSKEPIDYDKKFGREVLTKRSNGTTVVYSRVWISEKTWRLIPEPNDSVKVAIEYIEDVEYGKNGFFSFWDYQFNLYSGHRVDTIR